MAGVIRVTPKELTDSADRVRSDIGRYKNLYDKLYQEINGMKSSWSGEANQTYIKQIDGFKDEFENLQKVLESYVEFLEKSAKVYADTEKAIKDAAAKLTTGR